MTRGKHAASTQTRTDTALTETRKQLNEERTRANHLEKDLARTQENADKSSLTYQAEIMQLQRLIAVGSSPALEQAKEQIADLEGQLATAESEYAKIQKRWDTYIKRMNAYLMTRNHTWAEAMSLMANLSDFELDITDEDITNNPDALTQRVMQQESDNPGFRKLTAEQRRWLERARKKNLLKEEIV